MEWVEILIWTKTKATSCLLSKEATLRLGSMEVFLSSLGFFLQAIEFVVPLIASVTRELYYQIG